MPVEFTQHASYGILVLLCITQVYAVSGKNFVYQVRFGQGCRGYFPVYKQVGSNGSYYG